MGCPIRTSTDQRLLAAPRGFSQRATSFIASWCQGIHRMPFSRSRTPPCTETSPGSSPRMFPKPRARSRPAHTSSSLLNTHAAAAPAKRGEPVRQTTAARPETHQNLIHPDKDPRRNGAPAPNPAGSRQSRTSRDAQRTAKNHAPHRFGGDDRVRTDDPLLAKQVLSQLSYVPRRQYQASGPRHAKA